MSNEYDMYSKRRDTVFIISITHGHFSVSQSDRRELLYVNIHMMIHGYDEYDEPENNLLIHCSAALVQKSLSSKKETVCTTILKKHHVDS